ncbi:hypothetical protein PV325_005056, partial [Microctonus aethiopoides]
MNDPIVKVNQGKLRGVYEKNLNGKNFIVFRGVPYAKPPVGNLRFKDPEPLESWSGIRDAVAFSDRCAQQDWFTRAIVGSDDCLYLNVYTPTLNPSEPKAVMVWIHGGAFIFGSGEDDMYGPDYLIEKDIVLVTINYRLGIFGFLNAEDEEAPGNQGLKDQVQALRWIQQNISQFGGDPNNVTIFGESAGGASVHYLTISPLTQGDYNLFNIDMNEKLFMMEELSLGLFHKAIIQSGVAINPWASSPKSPMESVTKLAAVLDKDISDVKEFINYLRTLDISCLIEAEAKIRNRQDKILAIHPFIPSIDSKAKNPFLSIQLNEAIKNGIKVPSMCGYMSHEGIIVIAGMNDDMYNEINADPENLLIHPTAKKILNKYNLTVNDVKQFYFGDEKMSSKNIEKIVDALSTIHFILGIHDVIDIQSKVPDVPMYIYKFEYEVETSLLKKFLNVDVKGTCHGEEMSFLFYQKLTKLFDKPIAIPGSIEHNFIEKFTRMWTDFAKTGNPTPKLTNEIPVEWKPIDNSDGYKCLLITDKLNMITEMKITQQLLHQGKLRGVNGKNINGINFVAFRGIPYGKSPVGKLRFKDSEPAEPWSGVKDAFNFGSRCAQKDWITHGIIGSDDCLYLNIYTSDINPPVPKAVMVWIHGGGFIFGSGDDDFYGPDYLIEKDVVLVTINYRLGILGFLNVDDREAPGNQGLKDQVLALKWIKQNIAKFGGNPNNVTIFGESAGGASVHYLSISPLAQGLFHKVIIQSGVAFNPWANSVKSPMESVNKLAAALGKNISNVKEFVDYLRTLDAHTLVETEAKLHSSEDEILFIHPFLPSIDSSAENPFLIKPIDEVAKAGIKVPCMCGYVSHEGIIIAA